MSEVRRSIVPQTPDVPTCLRRLDPAADAEVAVALDHAVLPGSWHALAIEGVLALAHARLEAHRFVGTDGIDAVRLQAFRDFALESLHDLAWVMSESLAQSPWPALEAQRAQAYEGHRGALSGLIERLDAAVADRALLKEVEDAVVAHFAVGPGVRGFAGDLNTIGWV